MFRKSTFDDEMANVKKFSSDRKLIEEEVHNTLQIFRTLLQEDKNLCNKIDESYEEMLLNDLQTVPVQYDEVILDTLNIVKIFINNINFNKLSEELSRFNGNNLKFELKTFQMLENGVNRLEMSKKDRARIMNITAKFKPLFECVDILIYKPIELVRKIGHMRNNALDDLF